MIITQTPLRISLLGGNTDFPKYYEKYGGQVLTLTIDKYVYCIVQKRYDDEIRINYSVKEIVKNVDDIKHPLVREALKQVVVKGGIEITFLSDIPSEGSGLGSSSAVTIGLLNALHAYIGLSATPDQLAREACHIEIVALKKPIGVQDQWAIAYGGCKKIKFLPKKNNGVEIVPMSDHFEHLLGDSLMLFYTGKTRKAEKILSKMKLKKEILDYNKELVDIGFEAMKECNLSLFGECLDSYWHHKKKLNKYTTSSKIDTMYKRAKKAGAIGGKVVGAGGGGYLLLVVPPEKKADVRMALAQLEMPFNLDRRGSRVIFDI